MQKKIPLSQSNCWATYLSSDMQSVHNSHCSFNSLNFTLNKLLVCLGKLATWHETFLPFYVSKHYSNSCKFSVFHCMWACFIATYNEMLKFTGTTKHFSRATQSLKNNLTKSHDLKVFIKMELLKNETAVQALRIWSYIKEKSQKRERRSSLEIHPLQCLSLLQGCLFWGRRKSPG